MIETGALYEEKAPASLNVTNSAAAMGNEISHVCQSRTDAHKMFPEQLL